ncbi:MAG: SPOR domain-containing protein [Thiohalobacterales bacterium]
MTQSEQARVRNFSQRMRDEGSAGFADGPWDETEMEGDNELSTRQRQQRNWTVNATRTRRPRTLGDRVLTWMTILALITLIAGIAGAWWSYQPEPEITVLDPDSLGKTPTLERVESRLTRMEKRLSHILDPYIRSLNNLSGKLDDSQQQLIEHIRNSELQQATTATGFEAHLQNVEQRLAASDERMDTLSTMLDTIAANEPAGVPVADQPVPRTAAPADEIPEPVKGNWVINIASYANENIARRKLAQMQQQGVDVELVTAEVNGKTIYRARVFGFASRREASAASTEIKSKLGLEEIWITKRQKL